MLCIIFIATMVEINFIFSSVNPVRVRYLPPLPRCFFPVFFVCLFGFFRVKTLH